ncbi:MAG: 4-alpha-glucanotransferase, partial [Alphaproteobacteria bacterium]|nr:4-alpha-glucanotransferase [Alphaproteobacteria bacterium]
LEQKERELDRAYTAFIRKAEAKGDFRAFVRRGGARLLAHARFETLSTKFRREGLGRWQDWPLPYRDAQSHAVTGMAPGDPLVERHLFRQWLADRQLAEVQDRARRAGMRIGLVADIAVGMDKSGSHAWASPQELLSGLSIGAPPDPLSHEGQNWGLCTLSPTALRDDGFAALIGTLRAAMRHAGGIRIDHAMGLKRLWLIPDGGTPGDGAYLRYPFEDQLRLVTLESCRNRSIVVAEDLGTVPRGFRRRIARAGFLGMRILQFEKDSRGQFRQPEHWDREACALSTTHDLPTVAGWWRGRDLAWRSRIWSDFPARKVRSERKQDKDRFWNALAEAGCAQGPKPRTGEEQRVVDAALPYLANTRSELAMIPAEDIAGMIEQPNLPGTVKEHPNWRRRLPAGNGISRPRQRKRLRAIAEIRPRS